MTDDARYEAALDRFYLEPEAITDDDISTLAAVDDLLATKAAVRRSDALRMSAEARHRNAMGQPAIKAGRAEDLAELVTSHVVAALARPRQRIKSLESRNNELEVHIRSLENRMLELEARDAARTVDHAER